MKRPLLALISILVIIASGVSIYLSQRSPTARVNLKPFEGVGQVGAESTSKLLNGSGRLVLVAYDAKSSPLEASVTAFTAELKKFPGLSVAATERVSMKMEEMAMPEMGLKATEYLRIVQKHGDADAIVSFVGGPSFPNQDYRQVPERRPKFVVLSGYTPQTKSLMQAGVVNLAIVPRFEPQKAEAEPKTAREWFERFFMVVTPANMDKLPDF